MINLFSDTITSISYAIIIVISLSFTIVFTIQTNVDYYTMTSISHAIIIVISLSFMIVFQFKLI